MFTFSLAYLLIPFGIVFLLALLFFFFNVFHIRRYAIQSPATTLLLLAYFVSFLCILGGTALLLVSVDWDKMVTANDLLPTFSAGVSRRTL